MGGRLRRVVVLPLTALILGMLQAPGSATTTRAISLSVPSSATTSATVRVRGVLTHSPKGSLVVIRRRSGSSWRTLGYVRTYNSAGNYARNITVPSARGTYYFDAYAPRTSSAAAATSSSRAMVVRTQVRVSLAAPTTSPVEGNAVVLSGNLTPWVAGTQVTIQQLLASSSTWSAVATVTPNSQGAFSQSVLPPTGSTTSYRAVVPLRGYYTGATSPTVAITPRTPPPPPPDTTPPPPVSGLTLVANAANQAPSITLTWTDPSSTDYTGVVIRRTLGTTPPQSPTDGTPVADVAAPGGSFVDTGVQGSTTYSYALFAHDAAGNDAAAVTATATTPVPDTTPPGLATGVTATPVENGIALNWTDPGDADFAKVVIVRTDKPDAPMYNDPWEDTTVATLGRDTTTYTDTGVISGVSYYYEIFTYDATGNYNVDAQKVTAIAGCVGDPVVHVVGTLAAGVNVLWSPQCAHTYVIDSPGVTVPNTTTLTIAPGTVVKASPGSALNVIGTLDAVGTSAARITFTSVNDNSIGGATGSGSPQAGDWAGISVGTTWVYLAADNPASVLDLEYATVDYGASPISGQNSKAIVVHSSIAHGINEGIALLTGWEQPVIEDDTITDTATKPSQGAVYLTGGIDPNTIGGLSGSGNGLNATVLNGASEVRQPNPVPPVLTSSASWPIIIGRDASCSYPQPGNTICPATFGPGTYDYPTLTIAPGSVIKLARGSALQGSAIDAEGTAQDPITITSINDNSIGGVTGTGSPQPNDWEGIFIGAGAFTHTDSVFDHTLIKYSGYGINDDYGGVTLTNSTFTSTLGWAIWVVQDATDGASTIENNVIDNSAHLATSAAIMIQSGSLDLSRIYGNTGIGDGHPGTYISGTTTGSATIQADPSWPLVIGTNLQCTRTSTTGCSAGGQSLYVSGQLTVEPGAVVKFLYGSSFASAEQLTAQGTATAPVVFTSASDNSVGAPTGYTGATAGDWPGLDISGTATISYAAIKYATHGVDFHGTAAQDSVQHTWFDNNIIALYSSSFANLPSSTCTPPTPFSATNNTYGDNKSTNPLVTTNDYAAIQNALANGASTAPSGWTSHLATGTTDLLQWSSFTCSGAAHPMLATAWQTY